MRIGSIFTGTGGLEMALDGELMWVADDMPAARKLLAHHYPAIPNLGDVKGIQWEDIPPVDIVTAGFPCQPVSLAGKGLGEKDERWLWPEVIRAVRVLRPEFVLLENVTGLLGRGFGSVLGSLAEIRYDAKWVCLRASDAGAPHKRERVFVLAADAERGELQRRGITRILGGASAAQSGQRNQREWPGYATCDRSADAPSDPYGFGREGEGAQPGAQEPGDQPDVAVGDGDAAADTEREGRERETVRVDGESLGEPPEVDFGSYENAIRRWELITGRKAPVPVVPIQRKSRNHANPRKNHLNPEFASWMMGLPEGWITGVAGLNYHDQLRLSGNAVVPQQAALAIAILTGRI